jgi:hypothetical protein
VFAAIASMMFVGLTFGAYHHEGEEDANKFLNVYPDKAGTKLDHCALCHTGGPGKNETLLGSCQFCHYSYGYDGSGNVIDTLNTYGKAFLNGGYDEESLTSIESLDSDGDGYSNIDEINAIRFPGDANDDPSKVPAPYRIYTRDQIEAMTAHTQFMLMNTSRSGDQYAQYTGVPMKELLDDAGMLDSATHVVVYSVDGWSQTHPLEYDDQDVEAYHVYGNMPGKTYQYPPATYYYNTEADVATNPSYGWCEYDAPSCVGRSHGDAISVGNGLKAILAYKREGVYLDPGVINAENKLDGEGPFRVVVPQKIDPPPPPDQSSRAANQDVIWPYDDMGGDHNAGACSKSATIIKVEPLPAGTTDIDILEAGWAYVDQNKIIIYGAIDADTDGDGIPSSEEGPAADADPTKVGVREAHGTDLIEMQTGAGQFKNVACMAEDDPAVPQANKPASFEFPFGVVRFELINLSAGETVVVTLTFPDNVPTDAKYYKIHETAGWVEIPFGSNDGDTIITLQLTDGDATTDSDAVAGQITDPGALAVPAADDGDNDDDDDWWGSCFIKAIQ